MQHIIDKTIEYVKQELAHAEAGHDWFHVERVYKTALTINKTEQANEVVVALAALLHDIADPKFNNGNEAIGPQKAGQFLKSLSVENGVIEQVKLIIANMSFKNSFDAGTFTSRELQVVQDADRLDAMGAIGIARAFTYGGYKNRTLYDPAIKPVTTHTKDSYKNTTAPTINHFYEKLLLLKDKMNTPTAKAMAAKRHEVMVNFLNRFFEEWEGM